MVAYWASCTARSADCGAGLVLQCAGRPRMCLGVLTAAGQASWRYREIVPNVCSHHGFLRVRYGSIPDSLSGDLSPSVAPTPALRGRPNKSRLSSKSVHLHPAELPSTPVV